MSSWILNIAGVIILSAIIYIILPEGKTSMLIKCVLAIITLIVILNPLINYEEINVDKNISVSKNDVFYQDDYLKYMNDKKIEEHYNFCQKLLLYYNINDGKISIDYCVDKNNQLLVKKVTIDLQNAVIISNKEHIDIIEEVKQNIANYFNVDLSKIEVV